MDKKIRQEIEKFQQTLGKWFRHAYHNRASVALLYEKGTEIEEKVFDICPEYKDIDGFEDLAAALEEIELLHDSETREYWTRNKEVIYYHMRRLG